MAVSRYFTLLDIENAYWNIPVREEDKDKTGFVTPFGSFKYEKNGIRPFRRAFDISKRHGCHVGWVA
jgi:hypothetical protein